MRIFWNFATSDAGTLTASNTTTGYPASNLQLDTLGTQHRSDIVSATVVYTMDLGAATSISAMAFLGHNLTPGSDTVALAYASDAAFTTDTGSISVTLTAENWYQYFSAVSRRYWKITVTKALSANQVTVGRLVFGSAYTPTTGLSRDYRLGRGATMTDVVRTRGGQLYGNLGESLRRLSGQFPHLTDTDYDQIELLQNTNSTGKPFIISIDWTNHPTRKSIYGTLDRVTEPTWVIDNHWTWALSMTEQK